MHLTGYLHPGYAHSLREFGRPRRLPRSQGWVLERRIPGSSYRDAMGCYPLFVCLDPSRLAEDLAELSEEVIALCLVTDPFSDYRPSHLRRCFNHVVLPYKEHLVVDLSRSPQSFVCRHHLRYSRRACRALSVERCPEPSEHLEDWTRLYENLIRRHQIRGIPAFSGSAFAGQLSLPGTVLLRARYEERTVGMLLWYVQDRVAYYHLGAHSDQGYELRASYALFWFALEYFADLGLQWLDLGAGAGVQNRGQDGLTRFKRGWSTGTRPVYFCGHVFQADKYQEMVERTGSRGRSYFPAYRSHDFS